MKGMDQRIMAMMGKKKAESEPPEEDEEDETEEGETEIEIKICGKDALKQVYQLLTGRIPKK